MILQFFGEAFLDDQRSQLGNVSGDNLEPFRNETFGSIIHLLRDIGSCFEPLQQPAIQIPNVGSRRQPGLFNALYL